MTSKRFNFFVRLAVIAGTINSVSSQYVENVTKVGTTSAPFLNMPVGGRASAMGGAFSVIQGDGWPSSWRPPLTSAILVLIYYLFGEDL